MSNTSSPIESSVVIDDSSTASNGEMSDKMRKRKHGNSSETSALNSVSAPSPDKKARIEDDDVFETEEEKLEVMKKACRTILKCMGEDPDREGLVKTPERWAKALLFLSKGRLQRNYICCYEQCGFYRRLSQGNGSCKGH